MKRRQVRVEGLVQGVGFRPFVWRLAKRCKLTGQVHNDSTGVEIQIQGAEPDVSMFILQLRQQAPPLARIDSLQSRVLDVIDDEQNFVIIESRRQKNAPRTSVPVDAACCSDCRREIRNPDDRRFAYAFTNCTNCGPRYTIIHDLPYDRSATSMHEFALCDRCRQEYQDPADRRFHAQPNACAECGPRLILLDSHFTPQQTRDPIAVAARDLCAGQIVAIKGLGGFHLACDAYNAQAVRRLRHIKGREHKALGLMVADTDALDFLVELTAPSRELLNSPAAPIVLLHKKTPDPLATNVSPGCMEHGVMLAYTPLHILLLDALAQICDDVKVPVLVMTSANLSADPIIVDDATLKKVFAHKIDLVLTHDRAIVHRADDSLIRFSPSSRPVVLRASRGLAPLEFSLAFDSPALIALGAGLKNTVALAKGRKLVVSPHIGDIDSLASLDALQKNISTLHTLQDTEPQLIIHDLHPDLPTTRLATEDPTTESRHVQHHRAHIAACLVDNARWEALIGVAFDGLGYGDNGSIWGGEFFVGDPAHLQRAGHFLQVAQPGGDKAASEPWRMALAYLDATFGDEAQKYWPQILPGLDRTQLENLRRLSRSPRVTQSSSLGRLFDAVAALILGRLHKGHEAESAMALESAAHRSTTRLVLPFELLEIKGIYIINTRSMIRALIGHLMDNKNRDDLALAFHHFVIDATVLLCEKLRQRYGYYVVALSGGVFANLILRDGLHLRLKEEGFEVLLHRRLPPGDGCIAAGQAAIAAAQLSLA